MLRYVPWPHLPRLVIRLMAVEAQMRHCEALDSVYGTEPGASLLQAVYRASDVINPAASGIGPPLEVYLTSTWNLVHQNCAGSLEDPATKPLATLIAEQMLGSPCQNCRPSSYCRGVRESIYHDDNALDENGVCITPLKQVYKYARRLAHYSYQTFANRDQEPAIAIITGHMPKPNPALDRAVAGKTSEPEHPGEPRTIEITVSIPKFGLEDYLAVLYVTFHEYVVHGWCGVRLDSEEACASDAFHEGWMDWIAVQGLGEALRTRVVEFDGLLEPGAELFIREARSLSDLRVNFLRPGAIVDAPHWNTGRRAAQNLHRIMKLLVGDEEVLPPTGN